VNATDGSVIRHYVDDEPFDLATARLIRFERVLDLRFGLLSVEGRGLMIEHRDEPLRLALAA
jgi:alpha,alpha-trehalose phosphorylase